MTYEEIVDYVKKNIKKTGAKDIKNNFAVEIDICGEGEGAFYIAAESGAVSVAPYEYYDRDARMVLTAEELLKILDGKKSPLDSLNDKSLEFEGDISIISEFTKLIKKKRAASPKPHTKKA